MTITHLLKNFKSDKRSKHFSIDPVELFLAGVLSTLNQNYFYLSIELESIASHRSPYIHQSFTHLSQWAAKCADESTFHINTIPTIKIHNPHSCAFRPQRASNFHFICRRGASGWLGTRSLPMHIVMGWCLQPERKSCWALGFGSLSGNTLRLIGCTRVGIKTNKHR